ncbi:MAG TPA: hypothetical protein VGE73_11420 [Pseudolabrys sp.]
MTRTATLLTLVCLVIASAAVAGFIAARFGDIPGALEEPAGPVANRDGKADRLARAATTPAMPPLSDPAAPTPADLLRQAYANESQLAAPASDLALPDIAPIMSPPLPSPRPKLADMQKSYTLLSDMQIAGIKTRLQLTAAQAKHWPAVEDALRAVANKMHAMKQANPQSTTITLGPDTPEMQRLKTAATPLLAQLREDQKREVRALARIIGLDAIASRI